jgi:hypothetical protein
MAPVSNSYRLWIAAQNFRKRDRNEWNKHRNKKENADRET